jgi:hypothetical protein
MSPDRIGPCKNTRGWRDAAWDSRRTLGAVPATQRTLSLATARSERGISYVRKMILAKGARLDYHVEDDTGGGSAGAIAEPTARIKVGALVIFVTCTDQHFVAPRARLVPAVS